MQVKICQGKTCGWKFSKYILARLENDVKLYDWKDVKLEPILCMWECKKWPNILIEKELYNYVNPAKASELIKAKMRQKKQSEENKKSKKKK